MDRRLLLMFAPLLCLASSAMAQTPPIILPEMRLLNLAPITFEVPEDFLPLSGYTITVSNDSAIVYSGGDVIMPAPDTSRELEIDSLQAYEVDQEGNSIKDESTTASTEKSSENSSSSEDTPVISEPVYPDVFDGNPWHFDSSVTLTYNKDDGGGDVLMPDPGEDARPLYGDDHQLETLDVRVLANPFGDRLRLSIGGSTESVHIAVISPFGSTVYSSDQNSRSLEISASNWPSGNYVVYVRTSTGKIFSGNVIKR